MITLLAKQPTDVHNLLYLLAAVLFIFGLKMLSSVKTARRGNLVSSLGMLLAAVVTLFLVGEGEWISLVWITIAVAIGAVAGVLMAVKVPMTGMPQMVALLNGFGGIASLLVAAGDYARPMPDAFSEHGEAMIASGQAILTDSLSLVPVWHSLLAIGLTVLVGGVTFTGSLVAFGKLQGIIDGKPILFSMQKVINAVLLIACFALIASLVGKPEAGMAIGALVVLALVLGVLLVIPIGGADMPVVISLLNSYSGIAAAMAGFVLDNQALIITGALVGASGIILTNIMCKAMNRSLANVLFGGVGAIKPGAAGSDGAAHGGTARELTAEDVAIQLDAASQVVIVPGYGMAVAQAQHAVKDLATLLQDRGVTVKYAIHPVAGRMPGHMNVLLAEAGVDYENLCDLETINPEFEQTDVALVIGANDVTNPAARHAQSSPIYGMPILDVDKARSVVVIKRSLNPGFAGIENELYYKDNCGMLFGDGKAMVNALAAELKED